MTNLSLDTDAAAEAVSAWRDYGDQVESHGQRHHVSLDQLRAAVGDTYADYIDAKQAEMHARQSAYQRVAGHARGLADRLNNTITNYVSTDEENAARATALLD